MKTSPSNLSLSILLIIQDNQTANKNLKSRVSTQIVDAQIAFRLFIKKIWLTLHYRSLRRIQRVI